MMPWDRLRRRSWLVLWLPPAAWMGVIFFLSAQPKLPTFGHSWADSLLGYGAHLLEYGILAVLLARAFGGKRYALLLAFVLTVVYALSDEFHQYFVPGRHADPKDLMMDAFGTVLGLWAWSWLQRLSAGRLDRQAGDRP